MAGSILQETEAIIFDVDGTLWDSTEQVAVAWNQVLEATPGVKERVSVEWLKGEFGQPMKVIAKHLLPELEPEARRAVTVRMCTVENERVATHPCRVYAGVTEVIPRLAKTHRLCIVSNCQQGYIEAFLQNTGLSPYITDHACPDDTGLLKAENIRLVMERNRIASAVYVGDTQGDADACEKAGVPMIYAAYGFGNVRDAAYTIQDFRELEK